MMLMSKTDSGAPSNVLQNDATFVVYPLQGQSTVNFIPDSVYK